MKKITLILIICVSSVNMFSQTGSFIYDGVLRDYIYHVPSVYSGNTPVPLVINLHGYTSNASQQQLYTQFDVISDTAGFIVVYPNGLNNQWNSGWNYPYNSGTDDVGFISALIDTMMAHFNIDANRIHATGMSNGGFMSFRLACELSQRIASVASVTGLMSLGQTQNCNPSRRVPVMFVHGTADATVLYNGSTYYISADSTYNFWKAKNICSGQAVHYSFPDLNTTDLSTAESFLLSNCADNSEVYFIKINNGGHTWPGAFPLSGVVTNQDINASVEIWKFFLRHPMQQNNVVIEEYLEENPYLYPNPANNELFLKCTGMKYLKIFDVMGRKVTESKLIQDEIHLNTGSYPAGLYFLFINTSEKQFVEKVIIKHL